jgi:hypothetical protein
MTPDQITTLAYVIFGAIFVAIGFGLFALNRHQVETGYYRPGYWQRANKRLPVILAIIVLAVILKLIGCY